jgi:trehalose synthase-fused probable maltokinase
MNLAEWIVEQRWFASKGRDLSHVEIVEEADIGENVRLAIVEARFPEGTHELYQVLLDSEGEDALEHPESATCLLEQLRAEAAFGDLHFHWTADEPPPSDAAVRAMGVEQSNTSLVFGEEIILKVLRRLEPGDNPELELLRFLSAHGFEHIAPLAGWYEHEGRLIDAVLGIAQDFLPSGKDGWELAMESVRGGGDFIAEAAALGKVTGELHTTLGGDTTDPHFAPEEPGEESLALMVATIDEEIERVFRDLPQGDERLASIAGRSQDLREMLGLLSHVGVGGRVIRTHGDYHLGQTLSTDRGWVLLDFEGEPARSLPERRRKRSPLRDVAGMLRSFAYAATAADAPPEWEDQVRGAFLGAYVSAVDPTLLPAGQEGIDKLLAMFELEKSVYELRYELHNRPDWVSIPVAGLERLLNA